VQRKIIMLGEVQYDVTDALPDPAGEPVFIGACRSYHPHCDENVVADLKLYLHHDGSLFVRTVKGACACCDPRVWGDFDIDLPTFARRVEVIGPAPYAQYYVSVPGAHIVRGNGDFRCPWCGEGYYNHYSHKDGELQDRCCDAEAGCGRDFVVDWQGESHVL